MRNRTSLYREYVRIHRQLNDGIKIVGNNPVQRRRYYNYGLSNSHPAMHHGLALP